MSDRGPIKQTCHEALLDTDILSHVFEYDDLPLEAASQTCFCWREPALDARWRRAELPDLLRILSPWPQHAGFVGGDGGSEWPLTQDPIPEDWAHFHDIAHRIRHLETGGHSLSYALAAKVLFTNPKPLPLLPTIRTLRIHMHPQNLEQIPLFMAPSLRKIFIRILGYQVAPEDINQEARLLSRLHTISPDLLDFGFSSDIAGSDEELAKTVSSLRHLEIVHLYVPNLPNVSGILASLSTLPFLRQINITCGSGAVEWTCREGEQVFPNLSTIVVWDGGDTQLPAMVKDMASAKKLRNFDCKGIGEALPDLIEALALHQGLQDIRLEDNYRPLLFFHISPLHRCTNLRTLYISVAGWDTPLTDEDLGSLVEGMTRLRSLTLEGALPPPQTRTKALMSLRALSIVTAACPNIQSITLRVDASADRIPRIYPSRHQNLIRLNLTGSRIDQSQAVAAYLAHLSDHPDFEISCAFVLLQGHDSERGIWKEVVQWLPTLQAIRRTMM
ncbi:hypothetical protein FRB96_000541 [Tulasnella sp. 330]|nr:hypothetical protein FRB96_000541 [Tulasnella sp. 330]KAG8877304.1 hypothetical protein FRB97_003537 [Tulasnella sp. 331]